MNNIFLLIIMVVMLFITPEIAAGVASEFPDGNEYDIKNIPSKLKKDAGAVIRKDLTTFEFQDESWTVLKAVYAVTIFTKEKQHYGELQLSYDKFRTISDFEGTIYDADGEEIRDLRKSDTDDYSAISNYSLYEDARVRSAELYHDKFPYTIEYSYEIRYQNFIGWPAWYSRNSIDPVEYSGFKVITPKNYELRYWRNPISSEPEVTIAGSDKIYLWEYENQPRLLIEAVDNDLEDIAAIVRIAPYSFDIESNKGSLTSWKEFGEWFYRLTQDRDKLPESAINEIKNTILPGDNDKQRIQKLYKYMQSKTRYVSVQLGIGGWQPFDAEYVYNKGYGDCKALSNYMVTLLKTIDIKAFPVLINSGNSRYPMITEFTSNQFNHVIVCVPLKEDTVWLECTSQIMPAGNIGWNNENRNALMITPEGGVVVKTPVSKSDKNLQTKNFEVTITPRGLADAKGNIVWSGNQHDYVNPVYKDYPPAEKEKWIKNLPNVPDVKLNEYIFNPSTELESGIELNLDISFPKYGSVTGNRIFFHPNLMERKFTAPKAVGERLSPVRITYPYLDIDSILYNLPPDYMIEAIPDEVNINSSFGEFSSKMEKVGDETLLFIRSLEVRENFIPAENYSDYQKFFSDVVKADKSQVVLVKKPSK